MNIHYYIGIVTLIFYFLLLQFKKDVKSGSQKNFIYILFVPIVFYIYLYLFSSNTSIVPIAETIKPISISEKSSELMSNMFPLSSDL
jgi:hypothetical protein